MPGAAVATLRLRRCVRAVAGLFDGLPEELWHGPRLEVDEFHERDVPLDAITHGFLRSELEEGPERVLREPHRETRLELMAFALRSQATRATKGHRLLPDGHRSWMAVVSQPAVLGDQEAAVLHSGRVDQPVGRVTGE